MDYSAPISNCESINLNYVKSSDPTYYNSLLIQIQNHSTSISKDDTNNSFPEIASSLASVDRVSVEDNINFSAEVETDKFCFF